MKKILYILLFVPVVLFGQDNYSLSFDGVDDYIDFGVPQNFFEDTFVISVVFKPEEFNTNFSCLASRWNNCGQQSWWFGIAQGRRLHFGSNGDDIYYSNENMFQYSDAWIHYSVVRIGNQAKFYLDGVLVDNEINFFTDNNSYELEKLLIGAKNNADDNCSPNGNSIFPDFFNGKIYNLNIWDVALNVDEIQFFMNCPPTGNEEHLVGYWNFNEGSGDTVYDISGNGNNGTIHGATYSEDIPDNICVEGCLDTLAANFNNLAHISDDACEYLGCMNQDAINFDETATIDDEQSCVYSQDYVHGLWNQVDDVAIEFSDYQQQATTSLSSMQQALETWNTTIDLSAGWNMFGYGCPSSIDVADGLSNHTESIIITKDNNGNVYMPEFGFNGIGDFTPGFGYQIKLTEAIEGFSLCDWYVNDIPEDNIITLQEEVEELQAELDSIYGCVDETACNYDETAVLDDGSCYNNDLGCGCDAPGPIDGYDCAGNILPQYQVGDIAEGGIVFYVDETGEYGLVAALEDLPGTYEWGCYQQEVNGADATGIGTGYQNTLDIVNQQCSSENGGVIAAQAVLYTEINGYSDWYIPSKDELVEMYNTIGNGGSDGNVGNFINTFHWSSSEYINEFFAWVVNFNDGWTVNGDKYYSGRVRVIRAF